MLLAASESAVTKKPRLRLTRRRSSSLNAVGSFHCAMSRDMFTSCGIQWLAQPARYFSHAHLYLKGTSWFTSVAPLITRLSAACTRRVLDSAERGAGSAAAGATDSLRRKDGTSTVRAAGVKSSSKFSIVFTLLWLSQSGLGPHCSLIWWRVIPALVSNRLWPAPFDELRANG